MQTFVQAVRGVGGPFRIRRARTRGWFMLADTRRCLPDVAHGDFALISRVLAALQAETPIGGTR